MENDLLMRASDVPTNYIKLTNVISEKDIVKPYFERLKQKIKDKIDDSNTGWIDCSVQEMMDIIDSILEE